MLKEILEVFWIMFAFIFVASIVISIINVLIHIVNFILEDN